MQDPLVGVLIHEAKKSGQLCDKEGLDKSNVNLKSPVIHSYIAETSAEGDALMFFQGVDRVTPTSSSQGHRPITAHVPKAVVTTRRVQGREILQEQLRHVLHRSFRHYTEALCYVLDELKHARLRTNRHSGCRICLLLFGGMCRSLPGAWQVWWLLAHSALRSAQCIRSEHVRRVATSGRS